MKGESTALLLTGIGWFVTALSGILAYTQKDAGFVVLAIVGILILLTNLVILKRRNTMNEAQRRAIQSAIGNMQDNLYRARMQKRADPSWVSGNGETIDQVIAGYQKELDHLQEGL